MIIKYGLVVSDQERNVQYHKYTMTRMESTLNIGPDGPVLHQLHVMLESFPTSMAQHSLLLNIYSINVFESTDAKKNLIEFLYKNILHGFRKLFVEI